MKQFSSSYGSGSAVGSSLTGKSGQDGVVIMARRKDG